MNLLINKDYKQFRSPEFNFNFNLTNGYTEIWGATEQEDPEYSPYGPMILDLELTDICHGVSDSNGKKKLCDYCYKSNTPNNSTNLSFEDFKKIIKKVNYNGQLTQVAFGLGAAGDENPEIWNMCEWLRENHIIPNGTVADISDEVADKIAKNFGAVAVSYHSNFDILAWNVKKLIAASKLKGSTLKQINIHFMLAQETYHECLELIKRIKEDPRFSGLNAVVLLGLKKQGRAKSGAYTRIGDHEFRSLIKLFLGNNIGLGYDSCSGNRFIENITSIYKDRFAACKDNAEQLKKEEQNLVNLIQMVEPCESGLQSSFIDCKGVFYPCSFNADPQFGFDVLNGNFQEHWENGLNYWRDMLKKSNRSCPTFEV